MITFTFEEPVFHYNILRTFWNVNLKQFLTPAKYL